MTRFGTREKGVHTKKETNYFIIREEKRRVWVCVCVGGGGAEAGISLLPGGGPGQQSEARLRVPGEDDVPG